MGKHNAKPVPDGTDGSKIGRGDRRQLPKNATVPPPIGQPSDTGKHSDTNPDRQGK